MNALMAQAGWTYGANGWQANGYAVDISAQTMGQDLSQNVMAKVNSIFGLSPNVAAAPAVAPSGPTGGWDPTTGIGSSLSLIAGSSAIIRGLGLLGTPYAVPDANGYASGENEGINGTISLASTNLDCVGLVSAIFQTPVYSTNNFANNPYFTQVTADQLQPGDVTIYNAYDDNGKWAEGHAVVNTGSSDPNKAVLQSDGPDGVRFSADGTMNWYVNTEGYSKDNVKVTYYRYNGKVPQ
jgi:hypothetical protein